MTTIQRAKFYKRTARVETISPRGAEWERLAGRDHEGPARRAKRIERLCPGSKPQSDFFMPGDIPIRSRAKLRRSCGSILKCGQPQHRSGMRSNEAQLAARQTLRRRSTDSNRVCESAEPFFRSDAVKRDCTSPSPLSGAYWHYGRSTSRTTARRRLSAVSCESRLTCLFCFVRRADRGGDSRPTM